MAEYCHRCSPESNLNRKGYCHDAWYDEGAWIELVIRTGEAGIFFCESGHMVSISILKPGDQHYDDGQLTYIVTYSPT